ncbi:MAG TPA: FAD-linked oxidase C-terminal domain-containing protein [Casimicrobiaceae bacterium]|nr:FAD-linked oxidase C-terminal domain-containing protein [Casimicrobiaceae bacterium]
MNSPAVRPLVFHSPGDTGSAFWRLRGAIEGELLTDIASRGRYATDASIYQVMPLAVLVPHSDDDVRAAMAICTDLSMPILPRGAGSSQCGQTVGAALVVDHSKRLTRVVAFDPDAQTVTVEPGIVLDALNAWLRPHGLWFPVDVSTSAQATLGGMAGNNSCGSRSLAYGNMVHNVVAIDARLADGTEARFGPERAMDEAMPRMHALLGGLRELGLRERDEIERVVPKVLRRVGGYNVDIFHPQSVRPYSPDGDVNFAHLLVGSEGTLAWTRTLTLRCAPLPRHRALGVVNFATLHDAMEATRHLVALSPAAVELVDRTMIDLARDNPAFRPVIERALTASPQAILLVEFIADDEAPAARKLADLEALLGDIGHAGSLVKIPDPKAQKALWDVRKAGLNIMMSLRGDGKPVSFIEDCAVPLAHLADYVDRLSEIFARHGTRGTWYAHASVGTLHVRPILDMRRDGAAKMRAIAEETAAIVREYKGAFSGEHGDGLVRSEWVDWQFGPRLAKAFAQIKDLFDPRGLMNPGKIVRAPRMDDASLFRFQPSYRTLPLETGLDWSAWNVQNDALSGALTPPGTGGDASQGYAKAVEMCNNNGHCRKFDAGTMCPSYRVTGDEIHLTRGRANTLRLALSGQLGDDGAALAAVREALDLCVSCKGCRRECPTGVDMARMKIEFQYQWQRRHGVPLHDRLIAKLPRWAPHAAALAPLVDLRERVPLLARALETPTGVAAQRSLPRFRYNTFFRGYRGRATHDIEPVDVVLFVDSFTNAFEPENAHAALRVLRAAGYRAEVAVASPHEGANARPLCCGRTLLAYGFVDEARHEARRMLDALAPYVAAGAAIAGLEPSCLFTLRDEFLAMRLGDTADRIAERALTIEQFLVRERKAGSAPLSLAALAQKRALVHGHCHQKAFDAAGATLDVLRWIPGLAVEPIDSGCCGMAGAFGYAARHYDVSMRMAELSLLPAVRSAGDDTLVVADGTSCRHQIADGTRATGRREALHAIRVLAHAVDRAAGVPRRRDGGNRLADALRARDQ